MNRYPCYHRIVRTSTGLKAIAIACSAVGLDGCVQPSVSFETAAAAEVVLDTAVVRRVIARIVAVPGRTVAIDPRPVANNGSFSTPASGFSSISESHLAARKALIESFGLPLTDAARDERCRGALVPPSARVDASGCPPQSFRSVSIALPKVWSKDTVKVLVVTHELSPTGRSTFGSEWVFARQARDWKFIRESGTYFIE